ncbi:hypothetical protein [Variovorax sp. GB1P17]|uniref:hypothetical protein n=1 Tax=Variovorax sp. GB1P17 TaxID=3443740 RepID=UPI003F4454F6
MKRVLKIALGTLAALSFALLSSTAFAFSGDATDNAFAALLSMPGAGPADGFWDFPKPDDLPAANEAALIAYLAKQKKAGADFNAYRHFGTLLQHAIRAGQERTAIWLLANGADPRKTLKDGTDNAAALSASYKRQKVLAVLKANYGLEPPVAATVAPPDKPVDAARVASLTFVSPADDKVARAFMRKVAAPMVFADRKPKDVAASEAAVAEWTALAARMKPEVYARVIDDDQALGDLVLMHSRSATALDAALAGVPKAVLQRRARAALIGLAQRAFAHFDPGSGAASYAVAPDVWRALWRHLPKPVDYQDWPPLAGRIQPELWDELFASGYANRNADTALECIPSSMGADAFKAAWPKMDAHFGNARQAVPRIVLSPFRTFDASVCYAPANEQTRDKLLFMASLGIAHPVRGIDRKRVAETAKALLPAMEPFIDDSNANASAKPRLVDAQPNCRFELTGPLYRELLRKPVVIGGPYALAVYVESVQLIEIPGDAQCALLVGGTSQVDGYVSGDVDSFTGPETNPRPSCPDPTDAYEVWRERDGKVERLNTDMGGDDGVPRLTLVQDTVTGRRYYLHDGEQYGKCHGGNPRLPFTLEWKQSPQGPALMKSAPFSELDDALYAQCGIEKEGVRCKGITTPGFATTVADPTRKDAFDGLDIQPFLRVFRKPQFDAYQAAVLALDKPRLAEFKAEGVPGAWTAQAIKSLGAASLPLAEKRRRIAWLFADHAQLARTLGSDVLQSLLGWLPREDWGPVVGVVASNPNTYYGIDYLKQNASEKGLRPLACDFDRAQGLNCGETWGVNR